MKTKCTNCGKEIDRRPCRINMVKCFCGNSCQLKWEYANGIRDKNKITERAQDARREQGLNRFKKKPNTSIDKRGYKQIYIPSEGWKKYHHYVWGKSGRKIPEGFCLHHINGNKIDNRLKNLILITHHDHHKLHSAERERDENGRYT